MDKKATVSDFPHLLQEWDDELNGHSPNIVASHTAKKYYWKCKLSHSWLTSPGDRIRGRNCPYCSNKRVLAGYNDLATTHPDIAAQWHSDNEISPQQVSAGSDKKVTWLCVKNHTYIASIYKRKIGQGCSICAGKQVIKETSLVFTHPDIAAQWHPTKNNKVRPSQVTSGSHKEYYWSIKECGHEHKRSIKEQVKRKNCPYCAKTNTQLLPGFNDLHTKFPDIAAEWHPEKWRIATVSSKRRS